MEYKALTQSTIKFVNEVTVNATIDYTSPQNIMLGAVKGVSVSYTSTPTQINNDSGYLNLIPSSDIISASSFGILSKDGTAVVPLTRMDYIEKNNKKYWGLKNALFSLCFIEGIYSTKYGTCTIYANQRINVLIMHTTGATEVITYDITEQLSYQKLGTAASTYGYMNICLQVPKTNDDLILGIWVEDID